MIMKYMKNGVSFLPHETPDHVMLPSSSLFFLSTLAISPIPLHLVFGPNTSRCHTSHSEAVFGSAVYAHAFNLRVTTK